MAYPQQQHGPYGYQQPGGPPPKNNAPAIAVTIVLVAVLAGLGITGFVAPGFFLSDDKGSADARGVGGDGGDGGLPDTGTVPPIGTPDGGGGPDVGGGSDTPGGPGAPDDSGGSGDTGDAQAFAEEFIAAVNAADEPTAEAMICSDAPSNSLVSLVVSKNPQLEIAGVEDAGNRFVDFELGGTIDGRQVTIGGVVVRVSGGGSPCVFTFNAG
jgi:hypothetical protein